jgi:hypothetical protein
MALLASRRRAHRRTRIGIASFALALAATGASHAQVDEHQLKAAFVYNIAAFAQWDHAAAGTLTICLQADAALEEAVAALAGRRVSGRRVAVARGAGAGCDVLVRDARTAVVSRADTLVICDACDLPDGSSAIALVREGNRIRFDVDARRARDDGITLSSQLLRLARRVL